MTILIKYWVHIQQCAAEILVGMTGNVCFQGNNISDNSRRETLANAGEEKVESQWKLTKQDGVS